MLLRLSLYSRLLLVFFVLFCSVSIYSPIFWKCILILTRRVTPLYFQVWARLMQLQAFQLISASWLQLLALRSPSVSQGWRWEVWDETLRYNEANPGADRADDERHQVQMTLFETLNQVAQKSEIPLDFSDKKANTLLLKPVWVGFLSLATKYNYHFLGLWWLLWILS